MLRIWYVLRGRQLVIDLDQLAGLQVGPSRLVPSALVGSRIGQDGCAYDVRITVCPQSQTTRGC